MKRELNKHNKFYVDKAVASVKETEELKKSVEEDLQEQPKEEVEKAQAKLLKFLETDVKQPDKKEVVHKDLKDVAKGRDEK